MHSRGAGQGEPGWQEAGKADGVQRRRGHRGEIIANHAPSTHARFSSRESGLLDFLLRASTDKYPIILPSSLVSLFGGWPGRSSIARVERAPSERARSASRRIIRLPSSPPPSFLVTSYKGAGSRVLNCARRTTTMMLHPSLLAFHSREGGLFDPPLRASNEGLLRPRVARAQEIKQTTLPSHPLRRILLPCFFFCEPSIQGRQDHQRECR
jgi:hypothetical protein